MYRSKISGIGHYVPENVVTNHDLAKMMDTSDEWIIERTGIKERRFVKPGDGNTPSTMGTKAALQAMERAGITPDDIDFIIFATLSPDYYFPGPGVLVQEQLGIREVGALDVRNQCSGFVYALSVADQFIKTGMYRNILVIGSELHSGGLDFSDRGRNVSVIFGDGAGAVVISRAADDEPGGILSTHLHSEGKYAKELAVIAPNTSRWIPQIIKENDPEDTSYYPYMNGNFVFKHAVVRFSEVIQEALEANGHAPNDIDLLIPHQANLRISQYLQQKMGLADHQVYNNIMRYGNTTAASIPIAMSEAWAEGRIRPGNLICLAAFGSGFTWASALIRWI
ncbi:3-oxoacyl-ACP synthase III family protein [Schleiferia thermophila]|jgi:3-oxoacyl-[acyl-carrier-protein] synthase-3|uniref:3-oxoacyl-ACP synthase III family protein n=1 Tax=Schleiferia thermophila TaxID=884107 RepID=UPI0004E67327|nr:beta-ketoacyl-ACP synthase III [Schleiferia thermophila]KFD39416.1 3-oxoacyl-ACP synthase [Schleiferia thermophila str. Yellowstone]PMB19777.1 ketoacyl-ACP synthase III [Fischerella thermalis CCMEE 5319]